MKTLYFDGPVLKASSITNSNDYRRVLIAILLYAKQWLNLWIQYTQTDHLTTLRYQS